MGIKCRGFEKLRFLAMCLHISETKQDDIRIITMDCFFLYYCLFLRNFYHKPVTDRIYWPVWWLLSCCVQCLVYTVMQLVLWYIVWINNDYCCVICTRKMCLNNARVKCLFSTIGNCMFFCSFYRYSESKDYSLFLSLLTKNCDNLFTYTAHLKQCHFFDLTSEAHFFLITSYRERSNRFEQDIVSYTVCSCTSRSCGTSHI